MESVAANAAGFGEMINMDDVVTEADVEDISRRFLDGSSDPNPLEEQDMHKKFDDAMRDIESRTEDDGGEKKQDILRDVRNYPSFNHDPPETNEYAMWKAREPERQQFGGFSLRSEREEEERLELFERIKTRRHRLINSQGEDAVIGIPEVFQNDSLDTMRRVNRQLQIRGDSNAWSSIFETFLYAFTRVVESTFDGKRDFLGYRPNLKGWSETAKFQIADRRCDITDGVATVMGTTRLGGFTSLTLHLTASAFSHAAGNSVGESMSEQQRRDRIIAQEVDWSKKK